MRVAINAAPLQRPTSSQGRYLTNLLAGLGRVDGMNDYVVLGYKPPLVEPVTPSSIVFQEAPLGGPARGARMERAVWAQSGFPSMAREVHADLAHVPYYAPIMRPAGLPQIVTIRDVLPLALPEYQTKTTAAIYSRLAAHAARRAEGVITASEWSKRDIIEHLRIPAERIRVVREAPAPDFRRETNPDRLRAVRAKYRLNERFVLNVGGMDVRRNIGRLVGAFAAAYYELSEPSLQLFIAGDHERLGSSPLYPDWRPLAAAFGVQRQVVCAPVAEEDLAALYSAAACFAFTSRYEGFGLTALEAMACGAPVVCSNATSLPEVVGSAGILVSPDDTDALAAAIYRTLAAPELSADLRARGLAQSKQFSWDKAAAATSAYYEDVAGRPLE
ncbi:MAG: glycosyltransferase family 4 protein [Chloroflexota bacterium]|nr:glycosyltransferase family 4 protein [Chloroflexota bacterium]